MYTACMFCNKSLGSNEVVETFPVGRRLAFDARRGRLWVVCRKCERWNLSPLEERWEAVETCEKLFQDTRVRVSSENIGLARHPEGLELVRIGRPLRPEFAAWRYGDQFGRRRRRHIGLAVGGGLVIGAVVVGGVVAGASAGVLAQFGNLWRLVVSNRMRVKLRTDDGERLRPDLLHTRIRPAEGEPGFKLQLRNRRGYPMKRWFEGEEAQRFASAILPKMNIAGGKRETVQDAVSQIEDMGHPERFLLDVAQGDRWRNKHGVPGYVNKMPAPTKLALEMALHEEQERRALEGELWLLEKAWKDAEEIAAISDDLLLPASAKKFVRERRVGD